MSVPKRFGVLRFFATLLKVIAWIVLIVSILAAVGVVLGSTSPQVAEIVNQIPGAAGNVGGGLIAGISLGIVILLGGLLYFLILYVGGDQIHLGLAVEENTRLTAALLLRMHQETGQADPAGQTYAGGGFSNEPYDN